MHSTSEIDRAAFSENAKKQTTRTQVQQQRRRRLYRSTYGGAEHVHKRRRAVNCFRSRRQEHRHHAGARLADVLHDSRSSISQTLGVTSHCGAIVWDAGWCSCVVVLVASFIPPALFHLLPQPLAPPPLPPCPHCTCAAVVMLRYIEKQFGRRLKVTTASNRLACAFDSCCRRANAWSSWAVAAGSGALQLRTHVQLMSQSPVRFNHGACMLMAHTHALLFVSCLHSSC